MPWATAVALFVHVLRSRDGVIAREPPRPASRARRGIAQAVIASGVLLALGAAPTCLAQAQPSPTQPTRTQVAQPQAAQAPSAQAQTAQTPVAEPINLARRMVLAGALDLALARVEQEQPRESSAAGWGDWELLRLELLWRKGRDADLLKRVGGYRSLALPERASAGILAFAARAALRQNQPAEARHYLARVLLRPELAAAEYREARIAAIESYLAERNGDDAYQAMLRFQQDFAPLRREEAERFVSGLIALDRPGDAAGWLAQIDPASPATAILRLRAGLIKPEAAIAQARALIAKGAGDSAWALLAAGGAAQKSRAIEIEVAEARLNATAPADGAALAERSAALWKLYAESGQLVANEAQLLSGDDAAWAQRAGRLAATQPQLARALLGALALNARAEEARATAQLQILASLREAKLPLVALRLFADAQRFPVARLDPRLRLQLGTLAAESKLPAEALRYWQNLPVPAGMSAPEWQVRNLAVQFQAGMIDAGLQNAQALLGTRPPPPELVRRMLTVASEALDAWQPKAAAALFGMLLPLTTGPDQVAVLLGLGRARELTGEFRAAADALITAAVLSPAPETEREALRARESAALNLARAGMLEDARAVYQWLARNAKDAGIRENAARALKNL